VSATISQVPGARALTIVVRTEFRLHSRQDYRRERATPTMTKPGERPITLPHHGGHDYSRSLTAAVLRQAGLKGDTASERDQG
jgi:hypothetical protein